MLYLFYDDGRPMGFLDFYNDATSVVTTAPLIQGGMLGSFRQASGGPLNDGYGPVIPLGDGFDEGAGSEVKTVIAPATTQNGYVVAATTPLVLLDDGSTGYGTMFGHQFGYDSGSTAYKYYHGWSSGDLVGPNTMMGSGKVTGWFQNGLYGTNVYYTYTAETPEIPGSPLAFSLTGTAGNHGACFTKGGVAVTGTDSKTVAYFVSFMGDPSYVSTSFPAANSQIGGDTVKPVMLFAWAQ